MVQKLVLSFMFYQSTCGLEAYILSFIHKTCIKNMNEWCQISIWRVKITFLEKLIHNSSIQTWYNFILCLVIWYSGSLDQEIIMLRLMYQFNQELKNNPWYSSQRIWMETLYSCRLIKYIHFITWIYFSNLKNISIHYSFISDKADFIFIWSFIFCWYYFILLYTTVYFVATAFVNSQSNESFRLALFMQIMREW